jgi:Ca-activated chloride channel homolog
MLDRRRLLLSAAPALFSQDPVFNVDVKLIRLLATVRNANGEVVGGLEKADFRVFDNGAPQELTLFERFTSQPLSVALMMDISGSTAKEIKPEVDASNRFFAALFREGNPEDRASFFTFNFEVSLRSGFTRRAARLKDAMSGIVTGNGTALYDAIALASHEIEHREGRKVMIIISDGVDTASSNNFHQAMEAAQRADVVIYPILVIPVKAHAGRSIGGENAMQQLANNTGGRLLHPSSSSALDQSYAEILRDLRTQYLLGYYPKGVPLTRNRYHQLRVDVAGKGLRAVTRTGYYGEALR